MTKLQEIAFPKVQFSKFPEANQLGPLRVGRFFGSQPWPAYSKLRSAVTVLEIPRNLFKFKAFKTSSELFNF